MYSRDAVIVVPRPPTGCVVTYSVWAADSCVELDEAVGIERRRKASLNEPGRALVPGWFAAAQGPCHVKAADEGSDARRWSLTPLHPVASTELQCLVLDCASPTLTISEDPDMPPPPGVQVQVSSRSGGPCDTESSSWRR